MNPGMIIPYYPTYAILDEILSVSSYDTLNIYCDLKNNMQGLYMEVAVQSLLENTKKDNFIDITPFNAMLSFLAWHKTYAIKRNIDLNFIIFFETGKSHYHHNLNKEYKINRRIGDLFGLDRENKQMYQSIIEKNLSLIERACNQFPNVRCIKLTNLEADFVPYYLMRNKLVDTSPNVAHVTYSGDHDMWQNLGKHSYVFSKKGKNKRVVREGQGFSLMLGKESKLPDKYLPIAMAIMGEKGDDVEGIKGLGPAFTSKIVEEVVELGGGLDAMYKNAIANQPLFSSEHIGHANKHINKVIEAELLEDRKIGRNIKLVCFETLSRELDNPKSTEMLKKRKIIEDVMASENNSSLSAIKKALRMSKIFVEEESLDYIFHNN